MNPHFFQPMEISFTNKKKLEEFINHWFQGLQPRRNNWVLIAIYCFIEKQNKSVVALDRIAIAVPVTAILSD
jgi:hypothetical protein